MSFTLLNASAGSGKTQRITLEFLKLILPNPSEAARVLSITFTNKAAAEMKERLISSLATLASDPAKSKMLDSLLEAFPEKTKDEISRQADVALKYVLHHYSDIAISTIDSFMQRIIRTFARELQLPANYEVTVGDDELNELIITALIDSANLDDNITRVLKEIIRMQMDDGHNPLRLADELLPLVKHLTQEASVQIVESALQTGSQKMISAFDTLLKKNKNILAHIRKNLDEINDLFVRNNLTNDDFIKYRTANSIYIFVGKLKESFKIELNQTVHEMLESAAFLKNPLPDVEIKIRDLLLEAIELIQEYTYGRMMAKRFPVVALLSEIWRFREEYKAENNVLPVSDFNRIIREVLNKEPVPFIYLRAGSRYKTIMIDEFQDTSLMQWLNLLPLIHESLARGNSSWVVGDPKQSIYRWRNGKVEIMLSLPEIFEATEDNEDAEGMIRSAFSKENLECNYRSDINIVHFNSRFYNFIKSKFIQPLNNEEYSTEVQNKTAVYTKVYDQIEQIPKQKSKGYVECRVYEGKLKDNKDQWLEDIYKVIENCVGIGYKLSDIAILSRQNNIGVAVSAYLMGHKKPVSVISRETLQFRTSPHCRLAMCLFRLIHCPGDDLNATQTWVLMNQYTTIDFSIHEQLKSFFVLGNATRGRILLDFLVNQLESLNPNSMIFLPPVDQLDIIIHSLDISDNGGFFLLFLREQIMKQQDKTGFNSELLWKWWSEKGQTASVIVPDAGDAVNIMTIHSSKGLQFPVVIMPYFNINETTNLPRNLFWHRVDESNWGIPYSVIQYNKELKQNVLKESYQIESVKSVMDTINLMYVGTTRAEEKLFMFSFLTSKTEKKKKKETETPQKSDLLGDSAKALRDFINTGDIPFEEEKQNNYSKFFLGEISERRSEKEKTQNRFDVKKFQVNPNKPLDSLRSSKSGFDSSELRESAMKGKIIHELLSQINDADDVKPVVDYYSDNGWIENEKKAEYIQLFQNIVEQFPYAFPGNRYIMNERELADTEGMVWRPDRMICNEKKIWKVIDFKTGREKQEHKKQVLQYANLLSEAGMTVESSHIIYINADDLTAFSVDA